MIPLYNIAKLFNQEEQEVLSWMKKHKITIQRKDRIWLVDEVKWFRVLCRHLRLKQYEEYLTEEINIRREEINDILLHLDDQIYLLKSIQKISPIFRLLIKEMALLIPNELKRNIFIDITSNMSMSDVVQKYGLEFKQACYLYNAALRCIHRREGFIHEYRNTLAKKEWEIRRLEIENLNQKNEMIRMSQALEQASCENISYTKKNPKELTPEIIEILSLRLYPDLELDARTIHCLHSLGLNTVEDLLRYLEGSSIKELLSIRNFGNKSMRQLKNKLIKFGIMDEDEHSYLFEYL